MIAVGVAIVAVSGAAYYFMRARPIKDVKLIINPLDDTKKRPQPQTKVALQTMIKKYCEGKKFYGKPNTWDVTLVTDMSCLFEDMEKFNAPIDQWNTSEVTNMNSMFLNASSFNQPITMDMSQVTDMGYMFYGAKSFNQSIKMDTSQVTDMSYMFFGASSFNQTIMMDTSQVTSMESMFMNASSFNQPITMDTSLVINMKDMFKGATAMSDISKEMSSIPMYGISPVSIFRMEKLLEIYFEAKSIITILDPKPENTATHESNAAASVAEEVNDFMTSIYGDAVDEEGLDY